MTVQTNPTHTVENNCTAAITLPGKFVSYLSGTQAWADSEYGQTLYEGPAAVAAVNKVRTAPERRSGKGYSVTVDLTFDQAQYIREYADWCIDCNAGGGDDHAEAAAAAKAIERIDSAVFDGPLDTGSVLGNGVVLLGRRDPRATVCGECGAAWDDTVSTSVTPTPAGRCPFEADHDDHDDDDRPEVDEVVVTVPGNLIVNVASGWDAEAATPWTRLRIEGASAATLSEAFAQQDVIDEADWSSLSEALAAADAPVLLFDEVRSVSLDVAVNVLGATVLDLCTECGEQPADDDCAGLCSDCDDVRTYCHVCGGSEPDDLTHSAEVDGEVVYFCGDCVPAQDDDLDGYLTAVDSIGHDPETGDLFVTVPHPSGEGSIVASITLGLVEALAHAAGFDLAALVDGEGKWLGAQPVQQPTADEQFRAALRGLNDSEDVLTAVEEGDYEGLWDLLPRTLGPASHDADEGDAAVFIHFHPDGATEEWHVVVDTGEPYGFVLTDHVVRP